MEYHSSQVSGKIPKLLEGKLESPALQWCFPGRKNWEKSCRAKLRVVAQMERARARQFEKKWAQNKSLEYW